MQSVPTKLASATLRKYHIILKAGKRKTEDDMGGREDTVGEVKERKASMFRRKEILTPATTWMNLEDKMPSEINQTEKGK